MKLRRLMGVAPWAEGNTLAHHGTTTGAVRIAKALMSALGQKQTSDWRPLMSAIHPKADIQWRARQAVCQNAFSAAYHFRHRALDLTR
jgi:hypothetical protein